MLAAILVVCILLGFWKGGWQSLRLARQGDLEQARKRLRRSAIITGVCSLLLTIPVFGWPWRNVTISVPEEIRRTIIDTVTDPFLFFFSKTRKEPRDVIEIVFRIRQVDVFEPWLLLPMAVVGFLGYWLQKVSVQLAWRFFG